jgi:hypothetical protein
LESNNILVERIYIDFSLIKERSLVDSKSWGLVVDFFSDYCGSFFHKNESDLKTKIIKLLTDLKIAQIKVGFNHFDDAG